MGLSARNFLLSADDALFALSGAAFMRMLRREGTRLPDFAGQRVRQAGIVVSLDNLVAVCVVHRTFCILDFSADGRLDVSRLEAQQAARAEDAFSSVFRSAEDAGSVVEAASRFVARGGSWEPDERLLRRLDAAALRHLPCRRVRVVG